jgi:hypothetical protein
MKNLHRIPVAAYTATFDSPGFFGLLGLIVVYRADYWMLGPTLESYLFWASLALWTFFFYVELILEGVVDDK